MQTIIRGDCLDEMKEMADNSIDFIVTDPPYGISFMCKRWDYDIPDERYWREMLRIIKPGGHLAAMGGSRTFHRITTKIEDSGFEIRDCIMWLYGSGFPKSHNNFGFKGYGTALKPAYEPIILAMKPLEGTYKQNAEKWGVAGINIDESRISTSECLGRDNPKPSAFVAKIHETYVDNTKGLGRWPANLILDEEAAEQLDQMTEVSKSTSNPRKRQIMTSKDCPGGSFGNKDKINLGHNGFSHGFNDSGGASRFFYCAKASSKERNAGLEGMPLKECQTGCGGAMPIDDDGKERDRFKKKAQNTHPTVKPIALMKYILKLLAPPGNPTCLDPFAGSGSTLLAAKELGINCIGIEREQEYCDIANARLANL